MTPADTALARCTLPDLLGSVRPPLRDTRFLSALLRASMGKVRKRALRAPFWAGRERQVAGV
jgi:hypothetical protein